MEQAVKDYLTKHDIHYESYEHPSVFTVAESDKLTKHIPGARSKNLFLKDENRALYLVCMPGEKRLDMKGLRQTLELKELHFASPEELKAELHLTPGSVSILGMIHARKTQLIVDRALWEADAVGFHPNRNTATLVLSHKYFEKLYNSFICKKIIIDLS